MCRSEYAFNFFHSWGLWHEMIQAHYRGKQTLVQFRKCSLCDRFQVKSL